MHPLTKGDRLHQLQLAKARTIKRVKSAKSRWGSADSDKWLAYRLTPRRIGRQAVQHLTCDCWMCTAPTYRSKHEQPFFKGSVDWVESLQVGLSEWDDREHTRRLIAPPTEQLHTCP